MPGGNFKCHRCHATFPDNYKLNRHLEKKKPCTPVGTIVAALQWNCEPCRQSFSTKGNLKIHLRSLIHKRMVKDISSGLANGVSASTPQLIAAGPSSGENPRERANVHPSGHVLSVMLASVTGVQDLRQDQFYFGFAGPPEDWSDIRRSDGTPFVPKTDQLILKVRSTHSELAL